ncbi:peptidase C39 [Halalkalibacillus sediminis]|uniref:Peptidase C39 n=2 Tax=Halalkalibacillus sediminis TaxID=2018042 RepID=A0A2I0QV67_9BACI|nr:peptidase C39 [Halalkalibacillus sediminis]
MLGQNHPAILGWYEETFIDKQANSSLVFAENNDNWSSITENSLIEQYILAEEKLIEAPIIQQYPQLPRGCEVTTLAMLLNYHEIEADKMELADEIKKDPTPMKNKNGNVHFGNPHEGFVGDMFSLENPGYGVYNGPIEKLAKQYAGERVENLTGFSFENILASVHEDEPVLVITNTTFKPLPNTAFETWSTPQGKIDITMKEHSVLVVGYDEEFIYFNDPLQQDINKAPIDDFRAAWVQMGKQAITITSS